MSVSLGEITQYIYLITAEGRVFRDFHTFQISFLEIILRLYRISYHLNSISFLFQVMNLLQKGNKERTVEPTAANMTSSRSHALLSVTVKASTNLQGNTFRTRMRMGKLYMLDLAGSERASQTKNRGKRLLEGAHINRSLLALGNVINSLSGGSGRYVNYRDSKLTRLLREALSGNCRTVMIAHVSPASLHREETRNTLVYAARASSCLLYTSRCV